MQPAMHDCDWFNQDEHSLNPASNRFTAAVIIFTFSFLKNFPLSLSLSTILLTMKLIYSTLVVALATSSTQAEPFGFLSKFFSFNYNSNYGNSNYGKDYNYGNDNNYYNGPSNSVVSYPVPTNYNGNFQNWPNCGAEPYDNNGPCGNGNYYQFNGQNYPYPQNYNRIEYKPNGVKWNKWYSIHRRWFNC